MIRRSWARSIARRWKPPSTSTASCVMSIRFSRESSENSPRYLPLDERGVEYSGGTKPDCDQRLRCDTFPNILPALLCFTLEHYVIQGVRAAAGGDQRDVRYQQG